MTIAQQAEYLTANAWKQNGELWQRVKGGYLWETSAAVAHQRYLDRVKREEENGKDAGAPKSKRLAHP